MKEYQADFERWVSSIGWSTKKIYGPTGDAMYKQDWVQGAWVGFQRGLSINTAPGLAGTTLDGYKQRFEEVFNG